MYQIIYESECPVRVINRNRHEVPVVISIPHSGVKITQAMERSLKRGTLLANVDWYIPELYSFLANMGFTILINQVSRYVIDPNRDSGAGCQGDYAKDLIYNRTTFGKEMYEHSLSSEEVSTRMIKYYEVYHDTLQELIAEKQRYFDKVFLLDLHSFGREIGADIVLGNNHGASMDNEVVCVLKKLLENRCFHVAVNDPFRGGYITRHYGKTGSSCEALQIEISYQSYIEVRDFGEEYLPAINRTVMQDCQKKLKWVFSEMKALFPQIP